MASKKKTTGATYRVLNGINYPGRGGERRAEPGDVVDDLPPSAVETFLAQGDIEPAGAAEEG